MAHGSETKVLVQIDQPQCARRYGDAYESPTGGCTAVLGVDGTRKCFNTRATCQDPDNYSPVTLTLQFSRNQAGDPQAHGYTIPSIAATPRTTPAAINLGGLNKNQKPFGEREVVTIEFADHLHDDLLVDPYRLERISGEASADSPAVETYNPYTRGTFWGKWLARNPYYQLYPLRVYEGIDDQAISEMRCRNYVLDRIDGPADGKVRVTAKDIFAAVEIDKALAPEASRGELSADISAAATSATLLPAGIGDLDYPVGQGSPGEFYVQIGEEIIRCQRSSGSDTLQLVQRGCFNTTAATHDEEDLVQWVLTYEATQAHDIVYDLLCRYTALGGGGSPTGSDSAYIDKAEWDSAASSMSGLYTATISKPTPVQDLIGELMEQVGFSLWVDVETGMVKLRALRTGASATTLTDDEHIIEGSLDVKRLIDQRASQVWVYYAQIDPTKKLDEEGNFKSRIVTVDLDAEDSTQYGTAKVRKIFSRWIPQFGRSLAEDLGERHIAMFRDPPIAASLSVITDEADIASLAGLLNISTSEIQDESGSAETTQYAITQIERGENDVGLEMQSVVFPPDLSETERIIYIENDARNLNLRAIHDQLYAEPTPLSPALTVRFVVSDGIIIGSASTASPAITTGDWSGTGVLLRLDNYGRIQGKGGSGGAGASFGNGSAGSAGGDALLITYAITIDNEDGEIWGGGGGGGGGGGTTANSNIYYIGGGGGGSGAGDSATGGASGSGTFGIQGNYVSGSTGGTSTSASGGGGGAAGYDIYGGGVGVMYAGAGGDGGGPGLAGSTGGTAGSFTGFGQDVWESQPPNVYYSGGAGGAAGKYISGISFVTWATSPQGDLRGNVS